VNLRDDVEDALLAWDRHERDHGHPAVVDFDCRAEPGPDPSPAASRLAVLDRLTELHTVAVEADDAHVWSRVEADLAYLAALLGHRAPLAEYVRATQGCSAAGWPAGWIEERGELAREHLRAAGVAWGPDTDNELAEVEGSIQVDEAGDAIRAAADELEPAVRAATGTAAVFEMAVETVDVDAYWSYWLDGAGRRARLRINARTAAFTAVRARQFALHEVLGHALQSASFTAAAAEGDVPWVRLLSVHAPQQVLLEGLAQALPLFVAPADETLVRRVRLDHYLQLVRAELHLSLAAGQPPAACAELARRRVPFWTDANISAALHDRGNDPQLRSYLWSYPAGIDWFVALADSESPAAREVLHAAYRSPLTPDQLAALWPAGPPIGGPGTAVRLREPAVS
jgi:hypothetical protein